MRIGRTLPPAAAPIPLTAILSGLRGIFRGQEEIERFESELKIHFKVRHCFLVSSGKAALTLILKAIHELAPERNEVIIPAYTCYSVPSAVLKAGLKIKLCDINPDTLDFDFDQLKELLSGSSVLAVLSTHLFGMPASIDNIKKEICDNKIFVIEDAAQALGGELNQKKLGTLADVGFFSLGRGKAFSTVEGGIILTNNTEIAEKLNRQVSTIPDYNKLELIKLIAYSVILNIFMRPALFWFPKSLPFLKLGETIFDPHFPIKKMSHFQAGLAWKWNARLMKLTAARKQLMKKWEDHFLLNPLKDMKIFSNSTSSIVRFPLRIQNKEILSRILSISERCGLGVMRGYPDSINNISEIKDKFINKKYPKASTIAQKIITLPSHHLLKNSDIIKIINTIIRETNGPQ